MFDKAPDLVPLRVAATDFGLPQKAILDVVKANNLARRRRSGVTDLFVDRGEVWSALISAALDDLAGKQFAPVEAMDAAWKEVQRLYGLGRGDDRSIERRYLNASRLHQAARNTRLATDGALKMFGKQ